jgi:4-amino-4-deoxy-L-arabinose transferase-like glycosyltransferase
MDHSGKGQAGTAPSSRQTLLLVVILCVVAVALLFGNLGATSLSGSEGRWAEISREMLLTHRFFDPTLNGVTYFDKPLLGYWLVVAAATVSGRLDEWAVRAPSALAALIALLATVALGRRLWSLQVGLVAGCILLTTYGFLEWGRLGESDMETVASTILAVYLYWRSRNAPSFPSYLAFYMVCSLGAQTKGLVGFVLPVLAVLPDVLTGGRWRRLFRLSHVLGALCGVVLYALPFFVSSLGAETGSWIGLKMAFRENLRRYFVPFDHVEPIYTYLIAIPQLFLPWTPALLVSMWALFRGFRTRDTHSRYLGSVILVLFAFFTFSGSRRFHYILPLLPFLALGTAMGLRSARSRGIAGALAVQVALLGIVALVETGAPALTGLVPDLRADPAFPGRVLAWFLLPGLLATAWFLVAVSLFRRSPHLLWLSKGEGLTVVMAGILLGGFYVVQSPSFDSLRTRKPFAESVQTMAAGLPPGSVAYVGNPPAIFLFYADLTRPLRLVTPEDVQRALSAPSGGEADILVATRDSLPELRPLLGEPGREEESRPWDSASQRRKKLVMWRMPEPLAGLRPSDPRHSPRR